MKGCEALLVFLLCLSEAGAQNGPGRGRLPTNWELSDMVVVLSDMVVVLQEKMRNMEAKVEASEEEAKNLKMSVAVMAAKLTASETQVKLLQSSLYTSEGQTQDMNEGIEDLTYNVTTEQRQTEAQQITLNRNLGILKRRRRHAPNGPRVAFSVALSDGGLEFIGSHHDPPQTIVFKHVFFNRGPEGSGYNPTTGVFTAPWRGAYYLTFTIMHSGSTGVASGAKLVKNNVVQVSTWSGVYDMHSQTVILELDVEDTVNLITWGEGYQIFDDGDHHLTTFSGFLLYKMF